MGASSRLSYLTRRDPTEEERRKAQALMAELAQNKGTSKGREKAPVTIVEFSDFECPYCRRFAGILDEVLPGANDDIRVVFHHMPLNMHPWARAAAEGAACAQLQSADAFWAIHDQIFQHQTEITEANLKDKLTEFARHIKPLDLTSFQSCLENQLSLGLVFRDLNLASANKVDSTPTLW